MRRTDQWHWSLPTVMEICTSSRFTVPAAGLLYQQQIYCTSSRFTVPAAGLLYQQQVYCTSSRFTSSEVSPMTPVMPEQDVRVFAHGVMGRRIDPSWGGGCSEVDPLNNFSFQPVLHDWCNKGCGMYYPVCGMVHIKEPLLLIKKSRPCGGSRFPFSLFCPLPYVWCHKMCWVRR